MNTRDLTSLDNQFRKVEIAGVVRSSTLERNGRLSLSLRADETDVQVRVVNDMGVEGETLVDDRIAVRGVVDIAYDVSNHAIGAVLWVNDPSDIRVVEFPRMTASTSIESAGAIQGLDPKTLPIHRIRLHGGIGLNAATGQMQFHDETGSIPIETNLQFLTRGANNVDVLGFLTASQGHTVLSFPTIQENKLLASTEHGMSPKALNSAGKIHSLSGEEAAKRYKVDLHAVVTYSDPSYGLIFVQDKGPGIFVDGHASRFRSQLFGKRIHLKGFTAPGEFAPMIVNPEFYVEGEQHLPPPATNAEEIFSGGLDSSRWCGWQE